MADVAKVSVRRASRDDAAEIAAVHVRSWQGAYRGLVPQGYLDRLHPADRAQRRRQTLHDMDWSRDGWAEDCAVKQDDSRGFPLTEVRYTRPLRVAGLRPHRGGQ